MWQKKKLLFKSNSFPVEIDSKVIVEASKCIYMEEKVKKYNKPVWIALVSLFFQASATSLAKGSSGLGALNKACMDNKTVLICNAGLHLSEKETQSFSSYFDVRLMSIPFSHASAFWIYMQPHPGDHIFSSINIAWRNQ